MSYETKLFDESVVSLLKNGGVGLLPTDTIYGLSCRALDKLAVGKLHTLKGRDEQKPFIILISNLKMLNLLSINEKNTNIFTRYWPGPLSIVLDAPDSPDWLNLGFRSLAIRMPKNDQLVSLIERVGPIVSTSANLSNQPTVSTAQQVRDIFGDKLDFYVDGGEIANSLPSTLVRYSNDKLSILRQGSLKIKEGDKNDIR